MLPIIRTRSSFPTFVDRVFNDNWLDSFGNDRGDSYHPSVNVTENDKSFNLQLAVPGIEKKDFNLNVEDKTLTVSYNKESQKEDKNDELTYLRREFVSASFSKSFALPENVDAEKINATYNNGILEVVIPKVKEKSKLSRLIKISW